MPGPPSPGIWPALPLRSAPFRPRYPVPGRDPLTLVALQPLPVPLAALAQGNPGAPTQGLVGLGDVKDQVVNVEATGGKVLQLEGPAGDLGKELQQLVEGGPCPATDIEDAGRPLGDGGGDERHQVRDVQVITGGGAIAPDLDRLAVEDASAEGGNDPLDADMPLSRAIQIRYAQDEELKAGHAAVHGDVVLDGRLDDAIRG